MTVWNEEPGLTGTARRRTYWPKRLRENVQPPIEPEALETIWLLNFMGL